MLYKEATPVVETAKMKGASNEKCKVSIRDPWNDPQNFGKPLTCSQALRPARIATLALLLELSSVARSGLCGARPSSKHACSRC